MYEVLVALLFLLGAIILSGLIAIALAAVAALVYAIYKAFKDSSSRR